MANERERQRRNVRKRPESTTNVGGNESNPAGTGSENTRQESQGGDVGQPALRSRSFMGIAAAVAIAAIGAGAFMGFGGGGGGDQITDAENQPRLEAYQTLVASSGLPVRLVGADEVDDALASMPDNVSTEEREEMRQQINQGGLQLAWVTVWDTHAEDGDILRFESSSSIPIEVMALNAKTKFAIPYPADGQVLVTGVTDGGGGITIALESGAASIAWPTMAPGDQLVLPITPGF